MMFAMKKNLFSFLLLLFVSGNSTILVKKSLNIVVIK